MANHQSLPQYGKPSPTRCLMLKEFTEKNLRRPLGRREENGGGMAGTEALRVQGDAGGAARGWAVFFVDEGDKEVARAAHGIGGEIQSLRIVEGGGLHRAVAAQVKGFDAESFWVNLIVARSEEHTSELQSRQY